MSFPLINPSHQFFDTSGAPLVSGTLEFRDPTSNTLINSYPTADDADAQTNANANPLTLDSRGGYTGLYLEDGVKYKIILKDATGTTVDTQDDVLCPRDANYYATLASESGVTVDDGSLPWFTGGRYGLSASASSSDNTGNLLDLVEAAVTGKRNRVDISEGLYSIDAADLMTVPGYTGRIQLVGAGKPNKADTGYEWGTVLDFQNTTGDSLTVGDGDTNVRGVVIRDMGIIGSTTGAIVHMEYCPQLSAIENCFIANDGVGDGLYIQDV